MFVFASKIKPIKQILLKAMITCSPNIIRGNVSYFFSFEYQEFPILIMLLFFCSIYQLYLLAFNYSIMIV